ncbi:hypothetical protein G9A89_020881 [Geosiphon pyriformis]|nr:hypothetical protein G9A89_020881 [Geosiphon pyriformis]
MFDKNFNFGTASHNFMVRNKKFSPHTNLPWSIDNSKNVSDGPLQLPYARPKVRKFTSDAIEAVIEDYTKRMKDKDLARMFENCFPNTLDTTIAWNKADEDEPRTFIVTGDIPAMWLRDSTNQVLPYIRFARDDSKLKTMIRGVIYMQAECILKHPYANAYHPPPESRIKRAKNPWSNVDHIKPPTTADIWEAKWEVDSLAAFMKLSYQYWLHTGDETFILHKNWKEAIKLILKTIEQQRAATMEEFGQEAYTFTREARTSTETLMLQGRGAPVKRIGLVKSQFRPSDDSCVFPFLIPANAMLSVELAHLYELLNRHDPKLALVAYKISFEILEGIYKEAIKKHPVFGEIFAFEIDGYGSQHLMDDANVPSLLSLPYLGFIAQDHKIYQNTRNFVLSHWNKYWFHNKSYKLEGVSEHIKLEGIGGPHIGLYSIWPMSMCMRILTSNNDEEILDTLELLKSTTAGTGLMHESISCEDPTIYTRPWFAWANTLFGETILQLAETHPHLIFW